MNVSTTRIEANRRNAQHSTGPRTSHGKQVSSSNSLRHGILSQGALIEADDPEEFEQFQNEVRHGLRPVGAIEEVLVDRVVSSAWRLRRVVKVEGSMCDWHHYAWQREQARREAEAGESRNRGAKPLSEARQLVKDAEAKLESEPITFAQGLIESLASPSILPTLSTLARYETTIERGMYRALQELQRLQAARSREPVVPVIEPDAGIQPLIGNGFVS